MKLYKYVSEGKYEPVIEIPDNATNGDVIKALYPNSETSFYTACGCWDDHYATSIGDEITNCSISCGTDWWNSPYRKE